MPGHEDHVFSYYDKDAEWGDDRTATFAANEQKYTKVHDREDIIGQRVIADDLGFSGISQTVNSSCYDIAKLELALTVQERAVTFNFSLKGGFREGKATGLFVNGDNVGLATRSDEPGSMWIYDPINKRLELIDDGTNMLFSLTGNTDGIEIITHDMDGKSIIIPMMDHVQTKVVVGQGATYIAKARKGVRAVPIGSHVTVIFTADDGYVFEGGKKTYEKTIESVTQDIIFGTTPGYDLPELED